MENPVFVPAINLKFCLGFKIKGRYCWYVPKSNDHFQGIAQKSDSKCFFYIFNLNKKIFKLSFKSNLKNAVKEKYSIEFH